MMFGVTGGILAPVSKAWSGTILRPGLQADGVDCDVIFFPRATTPPVKVTLGETMTFAGSETAEITTAWIRDGAEAGRDVTG